MSKVVAVFGSDHLADINAEGFAWLGFEVERKVSKRADWVVIAHDTPVLEDGSVDLSPIQRSVWEIAPYLLPYTPIIVSSQVPVRTCERLEVVARRVNPAWLSGVVYVLENLKLTDGIERFLAPDMLVIGCDHARAMRDAFELFSWWTCPKIAMSLRSAEMVKHAINGWLAANITYANAIAALCKSVGADEIAVSHAMRMDQRMSKAPLRPGPSYPRQSTLGRDVYTLQQLCEEFGIDPCVK